MPLDDDFIPGIGTNSIKLDTPRDDLEKLIGYPVRVTKKRNDKLEADYDGFSLIYSPEGFLQSIDVYPESVLRYRGINIFTDLSIRKKMISDDGNPKKISGVIVLLNLGISMWEDNEEDDDGKSISVFSKGTWDRLVDRMTSYVEK